MTIIGVLFSCTLTAFGFARLKFPGRDLLFLILLGTMMLPYQVTMVPLYLIYSRLNWIDSYKPLWVSSFFGWSFYIFLLRQFLMTIPKELEDAAKIDGCNYIGIYYKIMLPLIKPALATVSIFSFMGAWNDFIGPVIYLNSTEKLTLSIGLRLFQQQYGGYFQMMMAAATFTTIPVIIVFIFAQKYFIQGIVLTGLKG
jgi:ABC-type glycerol-3-phosphate transport system permease component